MLSYMNFVFFLVFFVLTVTGNYGEENPRTSSKPLTEMRTCDIIRFYGYPCEIHHVTTKDGYILELHRVPHNKTTGKASKGVAFLQHGIIDSSFTWVANPPDQSLAYILADDGFDVWLGNSRGNTYSKKHTILTPADDKFWQYSIDEFAKYDIPASIDYVLETTNERQLRYIGHSQGTAIAFAAFSSNPSLARKIKLMVALAPISHVAHMKGLIALISKGSWIATQMLKYLGTKDFLPPSWIVKKIAALICHGPARLLCGSVLILITGFDTSNLMDERLKIYLSHTPAGTSVKDILHFSQLVKSDKFQMYDYGWNGNMHKYLQPFPPEYNLHDVNVPVSLFVGENDWLATEQDISSHLRRELPDLVYDENIPSWNHMDFVWGKQAKTVLYPNVLKLMNGHKPDTSRK